MVNRIYSGSESDRELDKLADELESIGGGMLSWSAQGGVYDELANPVKPRIEASIPELIIEKGKTVSEEIILEWYHALYRSLVCWDTV